MTNSYEGTPDKQNDKTTADLWAELSSLKDTLAKSSISTGSPHDETGYIKHMENQRRHNALVDKINSVLGTTALTSPSESSPRDAADPSTAQGTSGDYIPPNGGKTVDGWVNGGSWKARNQD